MDGTTKDSDQSDTLPDSRIKIGPSSGQLSQIILYRQGSTKFAKCTFLQERNNGF